jgi:hypothetical protein
MLDIFVTERIRDYLSVVFLTKINNKNQYPREFLLREFIHLCCEQSAVIVGKEHKETIFLYYADGAPDGFNGFRVSPPNSTGFKNYTDSEVLDTLLALV